MLSKLETLVPRPLNNEQSPREHLETKLAAISLKIWGSNEEKTRLPKVTVMAAWKVKCLFRVQKGRVSPFFLVDKKRRRKGQEEPASEKCGGYKIKPSLVCIAGKGLQFGHF